MFWGYSMHKFARLYIYFFTFGSKLASHTLFFCTIFFQQCESMFGLKIPSKLRFSPLELQVDSVDLEGPTRYLGIQFLQLHFLLSEVFFSFLLWNEFQTVSHSTISPSILWEDLTSCKNSNNVAILLF